MTDRRVPLTIGVTGHRDLLADEIPGIEIALRALFDRLESSYPDTPLRLITPLAEGGDRIAALVARQRGIPLVVPLPVPLEDYLQDFATAESRDEFHALCEGATVLDLCTMADHPAGEDRSRSYARAGIYTSDHCQILVAVWDGKQTSRPGGTADVVDYHQFGQMTRLGERMDARRGLAQDDTDLVFHIVCSRDRVDGEPAEGLQPGNSRWLIADPERVEVDEIPVALDMMIRRTGTFNRDVAGGVAEASPRDVLPGWREDLAEREDLARTADYFSRADRLAVHFRRRYRVTLRTLYALAALMGIAFIAYADLDRRSMIAAYLALFFVGFAIYRLAGRREWHRRFLDYRALAEGLRVQFYWRLAGVSGHTRNDFAYDNFLHKQDVEIGWIRNVMRFAGAPGEAFGPPDDEVDRVVENWIGESSGTGQLGYFESRCRSHRQHVARTDRLVAVTLWVGIAITLVLALFQYRLQETWVTAMVVAMGILPLLAAVRKAYAHKVAEKELLKQYQFMLEIYSTARFRLSRCESTEQKREILRALGEASLDEHAEWILIHRERPLEPGKL